MSSGRRSSVALLATAVFAVAIPTFSSAVRAGNTWTGASATSTSWSAAANWDGSTLPTLGTTSELVFGTAGFARPVSFIGTNTTVGTLTFNSNVSSAAVAINLWGFPSSQAAFNLTLGGTSAPGTINVDAGATQNITIGGTTSPVGNVVLGADLTINQNSSSSVLGFTRPFTGGSVSVTKAGAGTLRTQNYNTYTGPTNINGGRWIFAAYPTNSGTAGSDLSSSTSVVLGGGTMEVQGPDTAPVAKNFTIPFTVNAPSTLAYNNLYSTTSRALTLSGTAGLTLNAELAISNITANATTDSGITISRPVTGSGKIVVSTPNNVSSITDRIATQRVSFSGNNPLWTGGLTIARGTATLAAGTNAFTAGTGPITLGTTGDSFGAALGFNQSTNVNATLGNSVIVRSGGFRAIGNGGDFSTHITFTGPVTLENDLTLIHTLGSGRWLTFSGNITGTGGLNITRTGGTAAAGSGVRLSGTNSYLGNTSVATDAALYVDGSLTSNISVSSGGLLGGEGSTTGNVTIAAGSTISFDGTTVTNYFTSGSTINTTGGATTKIAVVQAVPALSGTGIVVLQANSLVSNGVSDFTLVGRGSLSVVGNQLLYNYAGAGVVWAGANATNPSYWDVNTTSGNFKLNGVNNYFFPQDNVLFDDTALNFSPGVQAALSAGTLTFDNSANAYTVSLAAVSSTGIIKNGTNSVTLNNDNNVAGSVAVNAGTLVVNANLSYSGAATVAGGQLVANTPLRPVTGSLVVTGPGAAVLAATPSPLAGSGFTVAGEFSSVSVSAGGSVTVSPVNRAANKASVLVTSGLSLSGGTLNLGTSDMVVKGGAASLSTLRTYVGTYLSSGGTDGLGSSSASPGAAPYTTLGVIANGTFGFPLFVTFDGVAVDANDALVKYTYVGDTDLNGVLDARDFNAVLSGFSNGLSGWQHGDVNYDGVVNATDWGLFLNAYTWYASFGTPLDGGSGGGSTIPEPAAIGLLFGGASLLVRRSRR